MAFDHRCKLLIRLEPLPLQSGSPVLKEAPGRSFAFIVPKLAEALLEQIGGVEPLVGGEQDLQCLLAVEREVLPPRQQSVFLALDIAPQKVADHDPIVMTLADRNLVDPDDQGTRRARACELCLHVLHLQRLDGVPVKRQFLRNIRDRRLSATAADKIGKALGVERVVCQKVEPFPFHLAAATAIDAPHLQLKQDSHVPAGQVTHLPDFAVVPPHLDTATASTRCFFERRFKVTIRTFGSPKTPRTTGSARKPSNEYVSQSRRRRFDVLAIRHLCQILNPAKMQNIPEIPRVMASQAVKFTHSIPRRSIVYPVHVI